MDKHAKTYFDWASAAPVSEGARKAYMAALEAFGNPSSPHQEGVKAKKLLEDARKRIATLAGTKPEAIIFTSGATEANNLALAGHIAALHEQGRAYGDMHLLYMPTSHASVVETVQALEKLGVQVEELGITEGAVDLNTLAKQIRTETVLVAMDLICGETGTMYHTRDVRRVLDATRKDARNAARIALLVDASQAPLVASFEHTRLGADFITLDAQKVGAVRGIGALIRPRHNTALAPLMHGGGQEQGMRPGTELPAHAQAFAVALEEVQREKDSFVEKAMSAREQFLHDLQKAVPDLMLNAGKEQAPHIINVSLPGRDTDYLVMLLAKEGFAVSTKSACETDATGSRTVLALTGDAARALATLRVSFGPTTDLRELPKLAKAIIRAVAFMDVHSLTP